MCVMDVCAYTAPTLARVVTCVHEPAAQCRRVVRGLIQRWAGWQGLRWIAGVLGAGKLDGSVSGSGRSRPPQPIIQGPEAHPLPPSSAPARKGISLTAFHPTHIYMLVKPWDDCANHRLKHTPQLIMKLLNCFRSNAHHFWNHSIIYHHTMHIQVGAASKGYRDAL